MDIVSTNYNYTTEAIKRINRCRIYLRVTTLSDIVNARGNYIDHHAYRCTRQGRISTTTHWPYQIRPGPKH